MATCTATTAKDSNIREGNAMFGNSIINTNHFQRLLKSVAVVGVVFFVIVSLLSTTFVVALAEHDHDDNEYISDCPATRNPVCLCENADAQIQEVLLEIAGIDIHEHDHNAVKTNCMACAFIQKIINPIRQVCFLVCYPLHTNDFLDACSVLDVSSLLGFITPVELRTKMSN